jgi:hypothetical protein
MAYVFQGNLSQSVKHNHIYVYLSMTTYFGLHRPSSGHYYKKELIKNTVKYSTIYNSACLHPTGKS